MIARDVLSNTLKRLTKRELEVLELVARGLTNRTIADHLFLQPRTIEHHLNNIYSKLRIITLPELHARVTVRLLYHNITKTGLVNSEDINHV